MIQDSRPEHESNGRDYYALLNTLLIILDIWLAI